MMIEIEIEIQQVSCMHQEWKNQDMQTSGHLVCFLETLRANQNIAILSASQLTQFPPNLAQHLLMYLAGSI